MNAIEKLSHRHEAILNWLLENPHRTLRECAQELGYTQAWLSQLIHSDIFQAKLRERQEEVFSQIAQDIPTKLRGLADIAIEKVTSILERTDSPEIVIDIFDKTLNRLGYAPRTQQAQVNVFQITREELASARRAIIDANTESDVRQLPATIPQA